MNVSYPGLLQLNLTVDKAMKFSAPWQTSIVTTYEVTARWLLRSRASALEIFNPGMSQPYPSLSKIPT
jgi:hypothetical protein